jgi:hypothetical protein
MAPAELDTMTGEQVQQHLEPVARSAPAGLVDGRMSAAAV